MSDKELQEPGTSWTNKEAADSTDALRRLQNAPLDRITVKDTDSQGR